MDDPSSVAESTPDKLDLDHQKITLLQRAQWLRAALLGANDGLLSTTSLMLGVGAAKRDQQLMMISGMAGALAGACSMAVGEFVSVSTQRDIEQATLHEAEISRKNDEYSVKPRESTPVEDNSASIPCRKAASPKLMSSSHMFSPARSPFSRAAASDRWANNPESVQDCDTYQETLLPNPYKAAGASGLAFLCGSLVPLLSALAFNEKKTRVGVIVVAATIALAVFGAVGARLGSLPIKVSAGRIVVGGWLSMAVTYGVLKPFDQYL